MREQINQMLILQDEMNAKVHPEWRKQQFEWYRAIWLESAELMDHHGWKWWKKQQPDIQQIRLEVVDIWHFGLSSLLQTTQSIDLLVDQIENMFNEKLPNNKRHLLTCVEEFAAATLKNKNFPLTEYHLLMLSVPMTFDELYRDYIGKNVLNFFRQDHGYKTGLYKKVWKGREDNEHLMDLMQQFSTQSHTFYDDLYEALQKRYAEV